MSDEINFLDLLTLSKVGPDTVVEKFSSITNSSFFDASNILGALKIKGMIDFTTSFPGQSVVHVTDAGTQLLAEAVEKAREPFDQLDDEIIFQLSRGKRSLTDISGAVNIRGRDLAMHLYKLMVQQYVSAAMKNGSVDISLTEKGFLNARKEPPGKQTEPEQAAAQPVQAAQPANVQQQAQKTPASQAVAQPAAKKVAEKKPEMDYISKIIAQRKKKKQLTMVAVVAVIVVVVVLAFYFLNLM
jgi:hypothetical protein